MHRFEEDDEKQTGKLMPTGRICKICGKPLSRYNKTTTCYHHDFDAQVNAHAALTEPKRTPDIEYPERTRKHRKKPPPKTHQTTPPKTHHKKKPPESAFDSLKDLQEDN